MAREAWAQGRQARGERGASVNDPPVDLARRLDEAEDRLERLFGPNGGLANAFEAAFEPRAGQREMAQRIWSALRHGGPVVVEAGTGTGKSLAYLAPAALWSWATGERVAISTQTLHLQEQLLANDIPLLERALGERVEASVQRGWQNYVCRLRAERIAARPHEWLEPGEAPQMAALLEWMRKTRTGVRSEIPELPSPSLWEKVAAESDACSRNGCSFYEECFFFRARRQALRARLLLVNHHLYFADVAVRRLMGVDTDVAVLPKCQAVIFDEAHHIERVATEYFGARVSRQAAVRLAHRVFRPRQGRRGRDSKRPGQGGGGLAPGLLAELGDRASGRNQEGTAEDTVRHWVEERLIPAARAVAETGVAFFDRAGELTRKWGQKGDDGSAQLRLPVSSLGRHDEAAAEETAREWQHDVLLAAETFCDSLGALAKCADEVSRRFVEGEVRGVRPVAEGTGWTTELMAVASRARNMAFTVRTILSASDEDYVYWMESRAQPRMSVSLNQAPIAIGEPFCESVVERLHTVGMVSATLAVAGSFDPFLDQMGLKGAPDKEWSMALETHQISSPFHYRDQAWIGIPDRFPVPDTPGYEEAVEQLVQTLLPANPGGAFVLFTSRRMMQQMYERISPALREAGLTPMMQGETGRTRLLERFRSRAGTVLFGTDSFWEGVDVPGEALSLVIVTRLPFRVPTDPVVGARVERMREEGRDPFYEYVLPQAVLKLRQGFGRLIRTQSDTGAVVICDARVIQRGYGRLFLESLPDCEMTVAPAGELAARLARFH